MKTAISTVSLPSFPWREALAEAAKAGYRNVELIMIPRWTHAPQLGETSAAEVAAEAARCGVVIIGLHAGALDGTSGRSIDETFGYVKRIIEFANEARIPLVNVNGGFVPSTSGHDPYERIRGLGRLAAALRELEPWLSKFDRRLALENHHHYQLETPDDYREVFDRLPATERIGITVDTGHFTSSKVDMPAFIGRFGDRVFHVHVKDHIGERSVPLGQGHTDNRSVVATLAGKRYDGYFSVELEVHDKNEVDHVRAARSYMDALADSSRPQGASKAPSLQS
jgi:sugar phosphate isomerase/epimerase